MVEYIETKRSVPGFYAFMGPLFGSRAVAKVVGIHLYDDEDKRWFLAIEIDDLIGCLSVRADLVSDCYVKIDHRMNGHFAKLLALAVSSTTGPLKANCTDMSQWAFKTAGFAEISRTKNFTMMRLDRA